MLGLYRNTRITTVCLLALDNFFIHMPPLQLHTTDVLNASQWWSTVKFVFWYNVLRTALVACSSGGRASPGLPGKKHGSTFPEVGVQPISAILGGNMEDGDSRR